METMEKTKDKLLPVLVDENLHYRMARFMYSANYAKWNGRLWLDRVPLLFGVWHPYKQLVHTVFKVFFPIFANVESTSEPRAGSLAVCSHKLLFHEKVIASLLLAAPRVEAELLSGVAAGQLAYQQAMHEWEVATAEGLTGSPVLKPVAATRLVVLKGLLALLKTWVPLIFWVGYSVRQCS